MRPDPAGYVTHFFGTHLFKWPVDTLSLRVPLLGGTFRRQVLPPSLSIGSSTRPWKKPTGYFGRRIKRGPPAPILGSRIKTGEDKRARYRKKGAINRAPTLNSGPPIIGGEGVLPPHRCNPPVFDRLIADDIAVAEAQDAVAVFGDVLFVGHQNHRFPLIVQPLKNPHNLLARPAV